MPDFKLIEISAEPVMPTEPTTFELPPVPDWRNIPQGEVQQMISEYGNACAEAARAPLAEENARLKEQVQRLLDRLEIESEDDPIDGILCRNTTIRELDEDRDAVAKQRDEARARIAELERSVDELAAAVGWTKERCDQDGDAPVDVADRLRAEVEVLRADAERYRKTRELLGPGIDSVVDTAIAAQAQAKGE